MNTYDTIISHLVITKAIVLCDEFELLFISKVMQQHVRPNITSQIL